MFCYKKPYALELGKMPISPTMALVKSRLACWKSSKWTLFTKMACGVYGIITLMLLHETPGHRT